MTPLFSPLNVWPTCCSWIGYLDRMDEELAWRGGQHCVATSSLGRGYYSAMQALCTCSAVTRGTSASGRRSGWQRGTWTSSHLFPGSTVGHGAGHVLLIKNNSFVVRPFPLPQKMPGQPRFSAIQMQKCKQQKGRQSSFGLEALRGLQPASKKGWLSWILSWGNSTRESKC